MTMNQNIMHLTRESIKTGLETQMDRRSCRSSIIILFIAATWLAYVFNVISMYWESIFLIVEIAALIIVLLFCNNNSKISISSVYKTLREQFNA